MLISELARVTLSSYSLTPLHKSGFTTPTLIRVLFLHLIHKLQLVDNEDGSLCGHYPLKLIILESEKPHADNP